jgi:hypothetical protein
VLRLEERAQDELVVRLVLANQDALLHRPVSLIEIGGRRRWT